MNYLKLQIQSSISGRNTRWQYSRAISYPFLLDGSPTSAIVEDFSRFRETTTLHFVDFGVQVFCLLPLSEEYKLYGSVGWAISRFLMGNQSIEESFERTLNTFYSTGDNFFLSRVIAPKEIPINLTDVKRLMIKRWTTFFHGTIGFMSKRGNGYYARLELNQRDLLMRPQMVGDRFSINGLNSLSIQLGIQSNLFE